MIGAGAAEVIVAGNMDRLYRFRSRSLLPRRLLDVPTHQVNDNRQGHNFGSFRPFGKNTSSIGCLKTPAMRKASGRLGS